MKAVLRISLVVCVVLFCGMQKVSGQWVQTGLQDRYVTCFAVSGTHLFAGTNYDSVFVSTDDGDTWNGITSGLTNKLIYPLLVADTNLFVGTASGVIALTSKDGINWKAFDSGLSKYVIFALAKTGTSVFAGAQGGRIFRSTDKGRNWSSVDSGREWGSINTFAVSGTTIFAGTEGLGVLLSTDDGSTWNETTSEYISGCRYVRSLSAFGLNLIAGTHQGVFLSSDNGNHWSAINTGVELSFSSIAVLGTNIFAGDLFAGIYHSSNIGASWSRVSDGLPDSSITSLAIFGVNLFAAVRGHGVWKRPLSEITGIDDQHKEIPSAFNLNKNFPNPFSPSTTISFTTPSRSFVSLKIFDALGKEVSTLVSGDLDMGQHSYQWIAEGLRSGVYLCRLQSGSFTATQKLSLMR
jgi:photosystem II stability/assembly factor-like uncharacterized protein